MRTPQEKANELISKFFHNTPSGVYLEISKELALICCDECIESAKQLTHHYTKGDNKRYADIYLSMSLSVAYWEEVKQEINKQYVRI